MTKIVRTESRKRGFFGHLFKLAFIAFNILMLLWLIVGLGSMGETINGAASEAERAGAAIGTALGTGIILFVWLAGAVILGIFTLITRGKKVIIEEQAL